ncbi:MAG: hypothetical protein NZ898_07230 [Myxococcota bacterium]|nr:hypothetical protein [Myxococcota bacterium]MDW8363375.1 hypothetical protein [Myxococcales bacterium]
MPVGHPPQGMPVPVPTPTPVPVGAPVAAPAAGGSNFGTITLAPGFTPDPHFVHGVSGGPVDARTWNPSCTGYVTPQPDHLLVLAQPFGGLRLMAHGGSQDVTLVVQRPDGGYTCNDDAEGVHPVIGGSWAAGTYRVWVGSYQPNVRAAYTLGLTELPSVTVASLPPPSGAVAPTPVAAPAAPSVPAAGTIASNFGTVTLAPGFTPDPHIVRGISGGAIMASSMHASCTGWIASQPDHVLNWMGASPSFRILARSPQDITLVVLAPDGSVWCNDDAEGTNPVISGLTFAPGTYRIWIGSYNANDRAPYVLGFTELAHVSTASLM